MKIAVAAGLLLHLAAFSFLRVVSFSTSATSFPEPYLRFPPVGFDAGNQGEILSYGELFDPTPLFLPTAWNYAPDLGNLALEREIEPLFEPFKPIISLSTQPPAVLFEQSQPLMRRPRDALDYENENLFSILGRRERAILKVPQRAGFLEMRKAGSGQVAREKDLPPDLAEYTQDLLSWVTFQVIIDVSGLIGDPLLVKGSGSPVTDQALREYLATPFLMAGLDPGYYKVTFGP